MRDDRHARHRRADVDRRRRPVDGHRVRDRARFERLVVDALADLPTELAAHLAGTTLTITDLPPRPGPDVEPLLGRYLRAETTRQRQGSPAGADRGRLELYRRPLESRATSKHDLAELVRSVVVHELAHHLGIDDDRLDELGWG